MPLLYLNANFVVLLQPMPNVAAKRLADLFIKAAFLWVLRVALYPERIPNASRMHPEQSKDQRINLKPYKNHDREDNRIHS